MNVIVSESKKLIQDAGKDVMSFLDVAWKSLDRISNAEDLKKLTEEVRDREILLRTKKIRDSLGDKLDEVKQKIAQLSSELEVRAVKLYADEKDKRLRYSLIEKAGVPKDRIPIAEAASKVNAEQRNVYLAAKSKEGTLPKNDELAAVTRLPAPAQARVHAKIGEIAKATKPPPHGKSVSTVIKHEEQKALKTWMPSAGKPATNKATEEHLASVTMCSLTRQMQSALSSIFKVAARFQGDVTEAKIQLARQELTTALYNCDAKWKELHGVGRKLAGNST